MQLPRPTTSIAYQRDSALGPQPSGNPERVWRQGPEVRLPGWGGYLAYISLLGDMALTSREGVA
jgi:hypothetical protein